MNQEIEGYLRLFINHRQDNWVNWLSLVEFALNNHTSESTKSSSFLLNYSKNLKMGLEPMRKPKTTTAEEFTKTMKIV